MQTTAPSPLMERISGLLDRVLPEAKVRFIGLNGLWGLLFLYPGLFAILNGRPRYTAYGGEVSPLLAPVSLVAHSGVIAFCLFLLIRLGLPPAPRWQRVVRWVILGYLGAQLVIVLVHGSWGALRGWSVVLLVLLVAVAGYESVESLEPRIRWWLRFYVVGSLVALALVPDWARVPPEHAGREIIGTNLRLIGLTDSPAYMGLVAALAFAMEAGAMKRKVRFAAFFAALAAVTALLTQSRIPMLAVGLVVLVYAIHRFVPSGFAKDAGSWVMGLSFAGAVAIPIAVSSSILLDGQESIERFTTGRLGIWLWSWEEFTDRPFFGQGHSVFTAEYWKHNLGRGYDGPPLSQAHNQMLETLVRGGLLEAVGLIAVVLLLLWMVKRARPRPYGMTVVFVGVVTFAHLTFGTPFRLSGISWNLVQLAVLVAMGVATLRDRTPDDEALQSGETTRAPGPDTAEGPEMNAQETRT